MIDKNLLVDELMSFLIDRSVMIANVPVGSSEHDFLVNEMASYQKIIDNLENGIYEYDPTSIARAVMDFESYIEL